KIGDVSLEGFQEEGAWGHLQRLEAIEKHVDKEGLLAERLKRLQVSERLPSIPFLSVAGMVVVAVVFGLLPFFGVNETSWSGGPFSNKARVSGADCRGCRSGEFARVLEESCLQCQARSSHGHGELRGATFGEQRCGECHMDRSGYAGLPLTSSTLCTSCHGAL